MLKETPKVGDVLIAKSCQGIRQMGDMTAFKEYEVVKDEYGDIVIFDDDGDARSFGASYFPRFTLKEAEPVGLLEVPKVGDVIIAINDDRGRGGIADITKGKAYPITKVTSGGKDAWFRDDTGFERIVSESRLMFFTLKGAVTPDKVGFIEMQSAHMDPPGSSITELTILVDSDGYDSVYALSQKSIVERSKSILLDKIAQCQAEMDSLNALLAEVSE